MSFSFSFFLEERDEKDENSVFTGGSLGIKMGRVVHRIIGW